MQERAKVAGDPLAALQRLEEMARAGQRAIREGRAKTGTSALKRIEYEAQDARRWASARGGRSMVA